MSSWRLGFHRKASGLGFASGTWSWHVGRLAGCCEGAATGVALPSRRMSPRGCEAQYIGVSQFLPSVYRVIRYPTPGFRAPRCPRLVPQGLQRWPKQLTHLASTGPCLLQLHLMGSRLGCGSGMACKPFPRSCTRRSSNGS